MLTRGAWIADRIQTDEDPDGVRSPIAGSVFAASFGDRESVEDADLSLSVSSWRPQLKPRTSASATGRAASAHSSRQLTVADGPRAQPAQRRGQHSLAVD
jgi:hypothetical protein